MSRIRFSAAGRMRRAAAATLLMAAWTAAVSAPGGGGSASSGHGTPAASDEPATASRPLGPPLDGYFDLTVLRRHDRLTPAHRLALEPFEVPLAGRLRLQLGMVVEFGNESGAAELDRKRQAAMQAVAAAAAAIPASELLTPAGKARLKLAAHKALNRLLETAQVRQVYFTRFVLAR